MRTESEGLGLGENGNMQMLIEAQTGKSRLVVQNRRGSNQENEIHSRGWPECQNEVEVPKKNAQRACLSFSRPNVF